MSQDNEPLAYSISSLRKVLGDMGRSTFYRLVDQGEFHPFKVGAKTLVEASEVKAFIARKKQEALQGRAA